MGSKKAKFGFIIAIALGILASVITPMYSCDLPKEIVSPQILTEN